jgi:hypothetical protein
MPTDPRSNEKARILQNIWEGVTILQWSKAFDATLGLGPQLALHDYSETLLVGWATA